MADKDSSKKPKSLPRPKSKAKDTVFDELVPDDNSKHTNSAEPPVVAEPASFGSDDAIPTPQLTRVQPLGSSQPGSSKKDLWKNVKKNMTEDVDGGSTGVPAMPNEPQAPRMANVVVEAQTRYKQEKRKRVGIQETLVKMRDKVGVRIGGVMFRSRRNACIEN